MSNEAINWALTRQIKHSTAKFVLVVLANCADAKDWLAWPSVAHLSEATGQDRKTVIENIKRLIAMGFITDTGGRKGSTKQVPIYKLNEPENGTVKESQKRDSSENGTVPKFPNNSTDFPHKESQKSLATVPKTGHGTITEPSIKPKEAENDNAMSTPGSAKPVSDFAPPRAAPMPMRETPPVSLDPATIISVALRRQGVTANSVHPAVQEWAAKGVSLELLTEAVSLAREVKGGEQIPPNYLVPIVAKLLNPPAAAVKPQARGSPSQDKRFFGLANVDRTSDQLAMDASMKRHGVVVGDDDDLSFDLPGRKNETGK